MHEDQAAHMRESKLAARVGPVQLKAAGCQTIVVGQEGWPMGSEDANCGGDDCTDVDGCPFY